jgi:hypothetical protein
VHRRENIIEMVSHDKIFEGVDWLKWFCLQSGVWILTNTIIKFWFS